MTKATVAKRSTDRELTPEESLEIEENLERGLAAARTARRETYRRMHPRFVPSIGYDIMVHVDDLILIGWKEIAGFFRSSEKRLSSHREELLESGTIFLMSGTRGGRPRPAAFPSHLKSWAVAKGRRGEII